MKYTDSTGLDIDLTDKEALLVRTTALFRCFDQFAWPYIDLCSYTTWEPKMTSDDTWYGWQLTVDLERGKAYWYYVGSYPDWGREEIGRDNLLSEAPQGDVQRINKDVEKVIEVIESLTELKVEYLS